MFSRNSSSSSSKSSTPSNGMTDHAVASADETIKSAQRVALDALDSLAGAMHALREQAEPLLDGAAEQASGVAHRGLNSLHDKSAALQASARQASERTVGYIRHDPVKSMLIAAATGAALMGLASLMRGTRHRHD